MDGVVAFFEANELRNKKYCCAITLWLGYVLDESYDWNSPLNHFPCTIRIRWFWNFYDKTLLLWNQFLYLSAVSLGLTAFDPEYIFCLQYDSSCRPFESRYSAKGDNNDMESRISSFQFPNLKNVKIGISVGVCLKYSFQWQLRKLFKLSEFLLKSSTILEKFTITSEKRKCKRCSMNCESPLLSQLAEKLLGCARSYAVPVIIFQE